MTFDEPDAHPDSSRPDDETAPDALGASATTSAADAARRSATGRRRRAPAAAVTDGSTIVQVFEPSSATRPRLLPYVRAVWERRSFLAELARSSIRGGTVNTSLGRIWGVLDPLFMAALYYFLFTIIRGGAGRPVEFLPVLVAGIFLFTLTTTALNDGGKSVTKSSALMLNSTFPRAVLPIAMVYKGLLAFVPTAGVYVVIYAFFGEPPQRGLLIVPVLFSIQTVLNLGIAFAMSTLIVFFRDAENALRYVQRLAFFTTPVIWPITLVSDTIRSVLEWTPLYPLFAAYQQALGGGVADAELVLRAAVWAFLILAIGGGLFLRYERAMASRL